MAKAYTQKGFAMCFVGRAEGLFFGFAYIFDSATSSVSCSLFPVSSLFNIVCIPAQGLQVKMSQQLNLLQGLYSYLRPVFLWHTKVHTTKSSKLIFNIYNALQKKTKTKTLATSLIVQQFKIYFVLYIHTLAVALKLLNTICHSVQRFITLIINLIISSSLLRLGSSFFLKGEVNTFYFYFYFYFILKGDFLTHVHVFMSLDLIRHAQVLAFCSLGVWQNIFIFIVIKKKMYCVSLLTAVLVLGD